MYHNYEYTANVKKNMNMFPAVTHHKRIFHSITLTYTKTLKDTSLCPLLVHDPVAALSASDRITGLDFIFSVTFCK